MSTDESPPTPEGARPPKSRLVAATIILNLVGAAWSILGPAGLFTAYNLRNEPCRGWFALGLIVYQAPAALAILLVALVGVTADSAGVQRRTVLASALAAVSLQVALWCIVLSTRAPAGVQCGS